MTHNQIQESLAIYRDLRGPARVEVDQHVAACAQCSALLNTYRNMDRDLSALRDTRPDSRLRQGFFSDLAGARPAAHGPRRSSLPLRFAAAMVVVLIAASAYLLLRSMPPTSIDRFALAPATSGLPNPALLVGTTWQLVSLDGRPPVKGSEITLDFDSGMVQGSGGCTAYAGTYSVDGDRITIAYIEWLPQLCTKPSAVQEQEATYTKFLGQAAHYRLSQVRLEILTARGEVLAFAPRQGSSATPPVEMPTPIALGNQAPQPQPDWEGAQVTLEIFSGRPDPSWRLPAEQAQQLRGLLEFLPEVACQPVDSSLGYRGFVVVLGQRPELSNEYRLRVHAGQVRWGDPWDPQAPVTCRSDAGRQVERFLLAGSQGQLAEDIYALVAADIGQPAPIQRYTDPTYGFAFTYPSTWTLEDRADPHLIRLHRGDFVLSIGVKGSGEATNITRSGVGAGDLITRATVAFLGQELSRDVLVYQDRDKGVLYNRAGEVAADKMVFTLSLDYGPAAQPATATPYQDLVLPQDVEAEADRIVESFSMTD